MRIQRVTQPPPPPEFAMTFPKRDGWAIVAALRDYARAHPAAAGYDEWISWAHDLDQELRR